MQDYTREQQCFTKENLYTEFILGGGGTHEYKHEGRKCTFLVKQHNK